MIKLVHRHNGKIPLISDFVIMWTTTVDVNDLFLIHMILFHTARTSCGYFICGYSVFVKEKFYTDVGKL